jgi:protein TonB
VRPIIFAALLAIGIHGLLLGNHLPRGGEGRVRGRHPQVIEKLPKAQKRQVISKKMVSASVKPEKVIFEEPETQEEIVTDIDVAAAVDIKKETPVVREAVPLYKVNPPPEYPRLARKRGYQGTVVLDVLVDQNGKVGNLRLFTSSGHSILDKKAMVSVKEWLFEPGMKGDKKLDMWVRVPVRFELK